MILRAYQSATIKKAKKALAKHRNTLLILPTGAGKTIIMSALAKEIGGKTLIVQHRQELLQQNMSKFLKVNPDWAVSIFDANCKSFAGKCVMTMGQTLTRNLDHLPKFDHLIHDEVHRCIAPTFARIIEACQERNPDMLLTGVSATPERSDKKSLRRFFNNVAAKVTLKEMVSLGFLVPPLAYGVDVGKNVELSAIKNQSAFGDQEQVAKILNTQLINDQVVAHWKERAASRKTIVFCATVQHALDVAEAFKKAGVESDVVTGDTADGERKAILHRFDKGKLQVLSNVAVLTEGYDSQPVSCIILLRQCSEKGPMIQMAGRGLRTVDPEIYPGVVKRDCIILDFGISLSTHGNLDQEDGLHQEVETSGEAIMKVCPEDYTPGMAYHFPDRNGNGGCGAEVPAQTRTCPICGFFFERVDKKDEQGITEFSLSEIDILNASPFRWLDLFGTETCMMACGFNAWAGVFSPDQGETWVAIGKLQEEKRVHQLALTGRLQAMSAADDFLRAYETDGAAKKGKRWLNDPATDKQRDILNKFGYDTGGLFNFTKYSAACHSNFHFNKRLIERALGVT